MNYLVGRPASRIGGVIRVPGDKSVSHRAIMFGSIARGRTEVRGFLPGEDCLATLAAFQAMGVKITRLDSTSLDIEGAGLFGLQDPDRKLDMGNSGTAMRLLAGLLAGQVFDSILVGDESLSRRPMERVAAPLRLMGARIETTAGRPPLRIFGGRPLQGIDYALPVGSAQVKSALLLAGLLARGATAITEPAPTRDHTERMLTSFGQPVSRDGHRVTLVPRGELHGTSISVPGDLSSAAFFVLAASLAREGELVIEHVGLNPTRTGFLEILRLMGADITIEASAARSGTEPTGKLIVRPAVLRGTVIPPELVPLAIDEFPAVFVAAALAQGQTIIAGAGELRHKESDRIAVMVAGLRALGIEATETPDGARIEGGVFREGEIDSMGDHRIAMAFAVGALRASGPVRIRDTANVATSFPGFASLGRQVGMDLTEAEQVGERRGDHS